MNHAQTFIFLKTNMKISHLTQAAPCPPARPPAPPIPASRSSPSGGRPGAPHIPDLSEQSPQGGLPSGRPPPASSSVGAGTFIVSCVPSPSPEQCRPQPGKLSKLVYTELPPRPGRRAVTKSVDGLPWRLGGTVRLPRRRHASHPQPRQIPPATEQLRPRAPTTEPARPRAGSAGGEAQ